MKRYDKMEFIQKHKDEGNKPKCSERSLYKAYTK
jgi:hypothetical protein